MNSYIYEFKDLPSTDIPYNAETFIAMQLKLLDSVFPIGRGFIDFTETDYSNYLGFTWERELVGLTPVGLDTTQTEFDTIGKTGGSKTHNHTLENAYAMIGTDATSNTYDKIKYITSKYSYNSKSTAQSFSFTSGQTDSATALGGNTDNANNLSPYKVVAYWKRVA